MSESLYKAPSEAPSEPDPEKGSIIGTPQPAPSVRDGGTPPQSPAQSHRLTNEPPTVPVQEQEPIESKWPHQWQAWTCLFGCFLLMFNSWGLVNAYGTYASYYNQHLIPNTAITLLNLVGSTQSAIVLAFSFIVGRLLDAGYSRALIGIGAFFVTLGMFMLSLANSSEEYGGGSYGAIWATQGLVTGFGMACFFVSSSQIVATWFHVKKAFAVGVVASGASISGLVYPVMTKYLINSVGFNNAVRYVSTLVAVTAIVSFIAARPNPQHKFRKPEKWMVARVWVDTHAVRHSVFCWFVASIALLFFGFYAVFFNLEEWAVNAGVGFKDVDTDGVGPAGKSEPLHPEALHTFWLLSIMNASSTVGRLLSAIFADRLGALNIHIFATMVSSLLILTLWILTTTPNIAMVFVVCFGAFSGAVIGLPPASMAYILGPSKEAQAKLGQWVGMMYTAASPFALTGPVIAGYLVGQYGTFVAVKVWAGVCLGGSAGCMVVARYYHGREVQRGNSVWGRALSKASTIVSSPQAVNSEQGQKEKGVAREV